MAAANRALGKRVLLLSRHHILAEAIKLGLSHYLLAEVIEATEASLACSPHILQDVDLVVVSALSPDDRPDRALQSAPCWRDREVPLLVITDLPLDGEDGADRVTYLDFPFNYAQLCAAATGILADRERAAAAT